MLPPILVGFITLILLQYQSIDVRYLFSPRSLPTRGEIQKIGSGNFDNSKIAIAISIIAEIQAVTQNRQGGFLRNRLLPIHSEKSQPTQMLEDFKVKMLNVK